jgi:hypothetical protein
MLGGRWIARCMRSVSLGYTIAARLLMFVQCPDGLVIGEFYSSLALLLQRIRAFCGAVTCISLLVPKDWIRHSSMPMRKHT